MARKTLTTSPNVEMLTPERIDTVIDALDEAHMKLEDAKGNNVLMTKVELNLLIQIEACRDILEAALRQGSDRAALKEIFGGDCWRIEWIRTLLESLELSPTQASDKRPELCLNACHSVEQVLTDLGFADALKEARARASQTRKAKEGRETETKDAAVMASIQEDDQTQRACSSPALQVVARPEKQAPPVLSGHLWKKSPNPLKLHKFQRRYMEIREAKLFWWSKDSIAKASNPKGCLDFTDNPCLVEIDTNDCGRFALRPKGGTWKSGNFTGADKGREFNLDAKDSEIERTKWIEAIREHILYGEGKWTSQSMNLPRMSYKW